MSIEIRKIVVADRRVAEGKLGFVRVELTPNPIVMRRGSDPSNA